MAFRTNKTPVLQTKSASGAVATFNTALAMPLVSCNIAVNAWQEGSGDPSPVNIRTIHGFSEVNGYQRAVNLWDEEWELGAYSNQTGEKGASNIHIRCKNLIPIKGGVSYFVRFNSSALVVLSYDRNGDFIGVQKSLSASGIVAPSNRVAYFAFYTTGTAYNHDISINYPSTDTAYHAYTGNIYTIQLGQEVYGAEVDVVNGVAHVTWIKKVITDVINWSFFTQFRMAYRSNYLSNNPPEGTDVSNLMCENLKAINQSERGSNIGNFIYLTANGLSISAPNCETLEDYESWIANNPVTFIYKISEPFDIQLTPQQIETIRGNNTIFADTGDVDLTYKDLDIAKRGNFREVFKLPS